MTRLIAWATAFLALAATQASADWGYEEGDYGPEAYVSESGYTLVLGCYYVWELPEEFLILYVPGKQKPADAEAFNTRNPTLTVTISGKDHAFPAPSRVAEDGTLFFEASLEDIGGAYNALIEAFKEASGSIDVRVTLKSPDETRAEHSFTSSGSKAVVETYYASCI